ncbi:MAG: hypothetical protein IKJ99_00050 [Oscillospiraceae bacterium]|nr:hypothetical protein [Oscillospiraceae bacterium]
MSKKTIAIQILEILAGFALLGLGVAGKVDSFWSGMGGALIGVGCVFLIQSIRYQKNAEYRENRDAELHDERNRFLSMKAWQLSGCWFTIIAAIGTLAFKFAGKEDLMMLCSGSVCMLITLYWVFWLYLRKKY